MSRWENAPDLRTLIRLSYAMVDLWCESYWRPPKAITLDIDDTADTVHGHQQLSRPHQDRDRGTHLVRDAALSEDRASVVT